MACRAFTSVADPRSQGDIRIAYVGLPLGAWALARAGFCPNVICLGHVDAPGARRVRRELGPRALVLGQPDLRDRSVVRTLASSAPDVLLSWFWPKQIPPAVLQLAPRGAYGVHPSLLPRWRGPDPYFWAIYAGDTETGVSLHALEGAYDTGAVIAQRSLRIDEADTAWSLARRLDRLSLPLLIAAAAGLARGELSPGCEQAESQATQAPAPDEELLSIHWSDTADCIVRLVRAAAPYPGASAELGESVVEILAAHRCPRALPAAIEPADAVLIDGEVVVQSGAGGVVVTRVRSETGRVLHGVAIAELFPEGLARL